MQVMQRSNRSSRSIYLSEENAGWHLRWRSVVVLGLLFCLGACGGGGGSGAGSGPGGTVSSQAFPAPHSQCSLSEAREDVLAIFEDLYFFNTEAAQVAKYADIRANLSAYGSVDALLDDLRFGPDSSRGFTYFSTVEEVEQFFTAGEFFGFGFSVGIDPTSAWRLIDVFGDSPADRAGMSRGDTLLTVNGVATSGLELNNPDTFGPPDSGVQRTIRFRKPDGTEAEVTLTKTTVGIDPVPPSRVRVFEVGGRYVGYLFFRTFISDADALLRSAMAELQAQAVALGGIGIDDLVVDLRYNGGGLVGTAEVMGSLMAGNARAGQVFFSYEYNDLVTTQFGDPNNDVRRFSVETEALEGLESVYYITDQASASASELLISGLEPYMTRSVTLGARTFGKPVGQWGIEYCNDSMVLFVVTFRTVNSLGEGDYYSGIPVNCVVADDWDNLLGDPAEGRLAAALDDIETNGGRCLPAQPVMRAAAQSLSGAPIVELPEPIMGASLAGKLLNAH